MNQLQLKQQAVNYATEHFPLKGIIGIGSGSTVTLFIEQLKNYKASIEAVVAASASSQKQLQNNGFEVIGLNEISTLDHYFDGADEVNANKQMIKGGGAALTREKVLATMAKNVVIMVDESKLVKQLGQFALPIEVIPSARSYVSRRVVKMGGFPEYRQGVTTDNGQHIIDVLGLDFSDPFALESTLNNIPGVVCNGVFAHRTGDQVIVASRSGIQLL